MSELDELLPRSTPGTTIYKRELSRLRKKWGVRFVILSIIGIVCVILNRKLTAHGPKTHFWRSDYILHGLSQNHGSKLSKHEAETEFLKVLESSNLARNWLQRYTSETHLAGGNYPLVEWTAEKFKEYGIESEIKPYYVYLNTPVDHSLKLIEDGVVTYQPTLKEDELVEDPTSVGNDTVPTFHGYSANGNVTGEFFYANYGRKQDYDKLAELGVDMKGKIAIVRYNELYRGLKVKFAEDHGVIGVLIYSDPGDDGEFTPANGYQQYPKGPARNEGSVQRGSVMFLSYGPGDPTTPGYASTDPDIERQDPKSIPNIPSLPISYREVLPILSLLNGTGLKAAKLGSDWVGGLPGYDYSIGPSVKKELNMFNEQDYKITPIYNVMGYTEGVLKNEVIVVGNHRDAWIKGGAGDPNSGSAVMLEVMRALHELQKKGYKPFRSIVWALWDGEEAGLLGSTEWGEEYAKKLKKEVVAYFNLDCACSGNTLALQASPMLFELMLNTAKKLPYPKGGSLHEHFLEGPAQGQIDTLGSGSDFTVFLDHLGIPSFDIGFASDPSKDPIYHYHSNYDSFYWMETFADPGFVYHNIMGRYLGLMILEISNQEVIRFNVTTYASEIQKYFDEVMTTVPKEWGFEKVKETVELKKSLSDFVATAKIIDSAKEELQDQFDDWSNKLLLQKVKLLARLRFTNWKLMYLERFFLYEKGLSGRSWFKHIIFASGRYTGYAAQSLPGLREAVEDKTIKVALKWVQIIESKVTLARFSLLI